MLRTVDRIHPLPTTPCLIVMLSPALPSITLHGTAAQS